MGHGSVPPLHTRQRTSHLPDNQAGSSSNPFLLRFAPLHPCKEPYGIRQNRFVRGAAFCESSSAPIKMREPSLQHYRNPTLHILAIPSARPVIKRREDIEDTENMVAAGAGACSWITWGLAAYETVAGPQTQKLDDHDALPYYSSL